MKWHAPLVILAQWALEGGRGYEAGKIDRARPERDIRFCTLIHWKFILVNASLENLLGSRIEDEEEKEAMYS